MPVARNEGDLRFSEVGAAWGLNRVGVSFGAATGDFDGDGDLDLAFANYQAGVTLLRNDCGTGHRVTIALLLRRSDNLVVGLIILSTMAVKKLYIHVLWIQPWILRGFFPIPEV